MPSIRIPKPSLGFVKRLLSQKNGNHVTSDSTGEVVSSKTKGKKPEVPLEECPICHDPVGIPNPEGILESWVTLHCQHKFGTSCIQAWLEESAENDHHSSPTCPMCRTVAKHACGHPIATPASAQFTVWLPHPNPSPPPRRARVRRRLSRSHRAGQGHHAAHSYPRPHVQIVGQCTVCKAAAAAAAQAEKSMKEVTTPQSSTAVEPEAATTSRRAGIKSMIFTRSRRQNSGESSTFTPILAPNPPTLVIANSDNTFLPLTTAIQSATAQSNSYAGGNPCRVPQMPVVGFQRVATPTPEGRRSSF
ncbi:hypothetical protein GGR57DRAFT_500536 [Xylariaceae sp. FL1272]|nr:hypothetical protein GGR57DRAFT_500536 [Xylariaceae sp. FL1272]